MSKNNFPSIVDKKIINIATSGSGYRFQVCSAPREIKYLVLHHTQAPQGIDQALGYYDQYGVSANYAIDKSGVIYRLVDDSNIAFHAGVSYWRGCDGLNDASLGIELLSDDPLVAGFTEPQMKSLLELMRQLIVKYGLALENIVGHSDIAYYSVAAAQVLNNPSLSGLLNRKQDPSHLFDWKFLAKNGVAIFPQVLSKKVKKIPLKETKEQLQKFGYRVMNLNEEFDDEMKALAIVFNRRFLGEDLAIWSEESQRFLQALSKKIERQNQEFFEENF